MKNNEIKRVSMEMEELEQVNGGIEAMDVAEAADVAMQVVLNKWLATLFMIGLVDTFTSDRKDTQPMYIPVM